MSSHLSICWKVLAVSLFLGPCTEDSPGQSVRLIDDEANGQRGRFSETSRDSEDIRAEAKSQLSMQIDLGDSSDIPVIEIENPFRIVLTNTSNQPIRIWNPRVKNGYNQLSFEFIDQENGNVIVPTKRQFDEPRFRGFVSEVKPETIEIAPRDTFAFQVRLHDTHGNERVWTGLPAPNTPKAFALAATFHSMTAAPSGGPAIWIGTTRSQKHTVRLVAQRIKTPHDYLRHGFPGRALEIIKADPTWIRRKDKDEYQRTSLHVAAMYGHAEVVRWLLHHGANANDLTHQGYSPLHMAADPEVITLLIKHGAELNILAGGQTPLQKASADLTNAWNEKVKRKRQEVVDIYLDAGAEYDPLTAIRLDDFGRVKAILKQSPQLADNFQKQSLLRLAASLGRLEICRYLIQQHHVDVDDFERGYGYSIIRRALDYPGVVRLLIESGADLKPRRFVRGLRTSVQFVGNDATLLHSAACYGVPQTVNFLIDHGVNIFATEHGASGFLCEQTALEVATLFGKTDNALAILNHPLFDQADERLRKRVLDKCLRIGVISRQDTGRLRLFKALLKKGADPTGTTTVQAAVRGFHSSETAKNEETRQVVSLLLEHGATLDLFSAVAIGNEAHVAHMLQDNPESANLKGQNGPLLHIAVSMNYPAIVQHILDAGGDVEIANEGKRVGAAYETALHVAAWNSRYEIAKLLIDAGADVNSRNHTKSTPLHFAATRSHLPLIRLLLESGAQIDAQNEDGKTPLDECREHNQNNAHKVEKVLREYLGKNKR